MSASRYIHVAVEEIRAVTDKALLCLIEGQEYWLPLSQVADAEDYEKGDKDLTLSITEWIADQKGLGD